MISRRDLRGALAYWLVLSLACLPARALVSLNDGHDHVFVTGSAGFGWDSNVFANSDAKSDSTINSSVLIEYTRRAGWIGVNAALAVQTAQYNRFTAENFQNPSLNVELTKQSGRTTGSLTLSVARDSRADAAVNVRSTSWNYNAGLNFHYPIQGMYTLSGSLGYANVKYVGKTEVIGNGTNAGSTPQPGLAPFPELATYTASADLIRIFSTDRDVMLGYRFRRGETSVNSSTDDHAFTVGMTGKLIRGLNGSLRAGYQMRVPHGVNSIGTVDHPFHSWTASASATYPVSKRLNFTGSLGKDFTTTANDISVDAATATLDMQYAYSAHWTLSASLTAGDSKFLGDTGRELLSFGPPPVLGPSRHDRFFSEAMTVNYSLNEHLQLSAAASWYRNRSNAHFADFADFSRTSYNLNVSSRW